uniref:Uncharacterized protein n=1 Tax=Vespula pensylvanica TaxID=30213 RepID=A0A834UEY6_VESPE|nr:hypothetical protein H0235_003710 [Vespula pensylvanica]
MGKWSLSFLVFPLKCKLEASFSNFVEFQEEKIIVMMVVIVVKRTLENLQLTTFIIDIESYTKVVLKSLEPLYDDDNDDDDEEEEKKEKEGDEIEKEEEEKEEKEEKVKEKEEEDEDTNTPLVFPRTTRDD